MKTTLYYVCVADLAWPYLRFFHLLEQPKLEVGSRQSEGDGVMLLQVALSHSGSASKGVAFLSISQYALSLFS